MSRISELRINRFVTALVVSRDAVELLMSEHNALPNIAIEFNDDDCVHHVAFAYVATDYPANFVINYTALTNLVANRISGEGVVTKIMSTMGTPHALSTSIRGLYVRQITPKRLLEEGAPEEFDYLSVFGTDTLKALLHTAPDILGLEYASVTVVDGVVLVMHNENVHDTGGEVAGS